jgi:hypothetical protein
MFVEIMVGITVLVCGKKLYNKNEQDNQKRLKAAEEEAEEKALEGVAVTVFIREPNGSRTNIEHYVERYLISRGAQVLMADQQAGVALMKDGIFKPLHPEAHFSVIGTLIVKNGVSKLIKEYIETEYEFNMRESEHKTLMRTYRENMSYGFNPVQPILEERRHKLIPAQVLHHQLSFRIVGRGGALLASGTSEDLPRAGLPSYDETLQKIAEEAMEQVDTKKVWTTVNIV